MMSRRIFLVPETNQTLSDQSSEVSGPKNIREKATIWGTSIGWAAGRSSIFTFLSYWGVVLGATPLELSILTSVRNLGANLFQSVWGWLADLRGRKLVIFIGLITLTVTTLFTPFARSPFDLVIIALIMTTVGFSIIPAWNAFLGDYASERIRATFVGRINSIGTMCSILLILTIGILMDSRPFPFPDLDNPESDNSLSYPVFFFPFLGGALIFGFTLIISLFLVEKYKAKDRIHIKEELYPSWRTLVERNPPFKRLLPLDGFFKFTMSVAWPIFPLVTLLVVDSWLTVALMWVVFHLPRGFGQNFGGKLADRYNKKIVLLISRLGYTVVPLGYALGLLTGNVWFFILVNIPGGFAFGAEDTSLATYSLDCSTEDTKARYYSILLTVEGFCAFTGSLVTGLVMDLWQQSAGITISDAGFKLILFYMLMIITALRFISASLHKFVYDNPLDFDFEKFFSQ